MLQTISEITIGFPTTGNYIDYADRFVDPALAFAAGFSMWIGWTALIASEATFFNVVVNYWANEKVPEAAWRMCRRYISSGHVILTATCHI